MTLKADILTDLDTFLNTDEFAVQVTYNSTTINGIFDIFFVEDPQGETGVETKRAQVTVKSSDVVGIAHDDTMIINSVTYNVIGVQPPDDTGLTDILLSED